MQQKCIFYKDAQISYADYGSNHADTIVLLHGFLESSLIWDDFSKQLSKEYRIVTIDLLGHGNSDCIGYIHSMELMAQCVYQVIEHLNISNFLLLGHSMGGYVALAFAEKYPKYLMGLVLFHSSAMADSRQKKESRLKAIEAAKKNKPLYVTATIPNLFKKENSERFKLEFEKIKVIANNTSIQGIVAALEGMRKRIPRKKVLRKINKPVLFIIGKYDTAVPLNKVVSQLTLASHTEAIILDKVGHMGFIEASTETLLGIQAFASKVFSLS